MALLRTGAICIGRQASVSRMVEGRGGRGVRIENWSGLSPLLKSRSRVTSLMLQIAENGLGGVAGGVDLSL
jgi:hypothetical protein